MKSAQREEYLKSQTHCLHVDGKTVKRCRRMVYRKSGYCYVHQREGSGDHGAGEHPVGQLKQPHCAVWIECP